MRGGHGLLDTQQEADEEKASAEIQGSDRPTRKRSRSGSSAALAKSGEAGAGHRRARCIKKNQETTTDSTAEKARKREGHESDLVELQISEAMQHGGLQRTGKQPPEHQ